MCRYLSVIFFVATIHFCLSEPSLNIFEMISFCDEIMTRLTTIPVDDGMEALDKLFVSVEQTKNSLEILDDGLQTDGLFHVLAFLGQHFEKMKGYVVYGSENSTLKTIANDVAFSTHSNSVNGLINNLREKVTNSAFLDLLYAALESTKNCEKTESTSQAFHNVLNHIVMANLEALVVMQSAYLIKKIYENEHFVGEITKNNVDFKKLNYEIIKNIIPYISKSSLEIRRCDPNKHIEDKTYIEVTNFLHGIILNEKSLGSCRDECDTFKYKKDPKCHGDTWCEEQIACPTVINCKSVDSSMSVCSSNNENTTRRYEYIEFGSAGIYGKKTNCKDLKDLESSYPIESLFASCSYCVCLCDEGRKFFSERLINLRLSTSDIKKNRVVTGIRFTKKNNIIHLQIQEGELLPFGQINDTTLRWIPPDDYKLTDHSVFEGKDYHTLSWTDRSFELVDIAARKGNVVTGVRFVKVANRINLELRTTPMNFTTGQLFPKRTIPQRDPKIFLKTKFGKELKLHEPDVPTLTSITSDIATDKFVRFTNSDFRKDAAQTTVPFFDAQEVVAKPAVPLSGIGVFYKGREGFGGFIAPRIFSYNITHHLQQLEAALNETTFNLSPTLTLYKSF